MASKRNYPEVECATDGCTTIFTKTGNRQKYCPGCRAVRRAGYYKEWYYNRGGANHLKKKYRANSGERRAQAREYYVKRGCKSQRAYNRAYVRSERGRIVAKYHSVRRVQVRREERIAEMEAGGRPFSLRKAPVSGPYLTGVADYQGPPPKVKKPVVKKPDVDPYAWDGSIRGRMNR